jgi:hypothetical protein
VSLTTSQVLRRPPGVTYVVIGASWGFLFEKRKEVPQWAWFVPVAFAVLGILRARGILKYFGQFRVYLARLEEAFDTFGGREGWQHFTGPITRKSPGRSISDGTIAFWAGLLAVTLDVAVWEGIIVPRTSRATGTHASIHSAQPLCRLPESISTAATF